MYVTQEIANRIKAILKKKNKNMKEMLFELNMGINSISEFAKGKQMSCISLAHIADYLDCSVDYLLGRSERYYFTNTTSQKENVMNIIAEIREAENISIEKLAELISVDVAELKKYEENELQPSIEIIEKIANKFDVSVMYLLGQYSDIKYNASARNTVNSWLKATTKSNAEIEKAVKCNYATIQTWSIGFGDYFDNKLYLLSKLIGLSVDEIVGNYSFSNGEVAAFGAKFSEIQNSIDEETTE